MENHNLQGIDHLRTFAGELADIDKIFAGHLLNLVDNLEAEPASQARPDKYRSLSPEFFAENMRSALLEKAARNLRPWKTLRTLLLMVLILYDGIIIVLPLSWHFNTATIIIVNLLSILLLIFGTALLNWKEEQYRKTTRNQALQLTLEYSDLMLILEENRRFAALDTDQRSLALLESIHNFVETFQSHSSELEKIIITEQRRLSDLAAVQKDEAAQLSEIRSVITEFSQGLAASGPQFIQALQSFHSTTATFAAETQKLCQMQGQQPAILQQLGAHLGEFKTETAKLAQVEKKISSDLIKAVSQNLVKSEELVVNLESLEKIVRQISESQLNLQNLLDDQMRANDGWVRSLQQSTRALSSAIDTAPKQ